jgi:hypothetical protein
VRRAALILCLLAFTGSAGLWVRSYITADAIRAQYRNDWVMIESVRGGIVIVYMDVILLPADTYWSWHRVPTSAEGPTDRAARKGAVMGFKWRTENNLIRLPLWFPTLASGLLSLCLWRRGRRKQAGRGFPVDQPPPPAS